MSGQGLTIEEQAIIYAQELARLQRLRRVYERLLPISLDPDEPQLPEPEVRAATVLFTDLRGFTHLAEHFADDPSRLLHIVNEHLRAVVSAINRCGGVVEKFVGDGVMATFGARVSLPDHAARAVAAAMAVVGANEVLNRRRAGEWGFRLDVGVGAAAGKVVVASLGPPERAEPGVLGDPVNIAARLASQARSGEVLLASSVYRAVSSSVRAELLGRSAVRGRAGRIEVYRITFSIR